MSSCKYLRITLDYAHTKRPHIKVAKGYTQKRIRSLRQCPPYYPQNYHQNHIRTLHLLRSFPSLHHIPYPSLYCKLPQPSRFTRSCRSPELPEGKLLPVLPPSHSTPIICGFPHTVYTHNTLGIA